MDSVVNKIQIAIDNIIYDGWKDIAIERSIENMCGQFSFSTTVKEVVGALTGKDLDVRIIKNPIKVQSEVAIFIDSTLVLTGTIENLSVNYNPTTHTISASGRDRTGDLIDSSCIKRQYSERNFAKLLRLVLDDNGYSNIDIINNLPLPAILPANEVIRIENNDTIFSFIDKYAQRLQVFILTDADGNIVISTEGSRGSSGALISEKNGQKNNIISANFNVSSSDRFKYIDIYSQTDNRTFGRNSISQKGSHIDNEILTPRRKIIIAGKATQRTTLDKLAEWNVTLRKAKGQRYDVQVAGYYTGRIDGLLTDRFNGRLWEINTLVEVLDDKAGLNGLYLIQGIKYSKNDNGSFTDLSIVERGSFTIDPEKKFDLIPKKNDFTKT